MKLDRNALEKLLNLNDSQLKNLMETIALESGIDLSKFNISTQDISSIRSALSNATDRDIEMAEKQISEYKKKSNPS